MITNINELISFMDDEAAQWGREDATQITVNGKGIRKQWDDLTEYPSPVYYLKYNAEPVESPHRARFDLTSMWFTEEGNVTDRPKRNTAPLYHND